MTQRRRKRRNRAARRLKIWIGILSVVLVTLVAIALLPREPEDTLQTDPPAQSDPDTHPTETQPQTQPTVPSTEPSEPPLSGWVEEHGNTYYYDNGIPLTGVQTIGEKRYCFDESGALLPEGWQEVAGSRYYLNSDGTAFTGWLEQEDGLYYLRTDGTMARGEVEIDGIRYYFTSAGRHIYLVNPWNYVPEGYEPELIELTSRYAATGTRVEKVDSSCYDALIRMMDDCKAAGHSVCVVSSYRTHEYQEYLFERQVTKQMAALNCTREEAEIVAATISAIPGTSEHQLGLAVDIIDTQLWKLVEEQEDLAGQQWLMEHCWEYGFILRYPKDKTPQTGIIYEPWHYRYVGTEVAAELHESGLTLEEYLEALTQ